MKIHLLITAALFAGLCGCASKPMAPAPAPVSTAPAAAPTVTRPAGAAAVTSPAPASAHTSPPVPLGSALAAEQKRLAELFQGTPVVFAMQADGSMKVDVPLSFCFDRGGFTVKPPLAAVLDRLAWSQRGDTTKLHVSAAGDTAASGANLARDRAASARDYMVARGVLAERVVLASGAPGEGIEIVVSDSAPAKP